MGSDRPRRRGGEESAEGYAGRGMAEMGYSLPLQALQGIHHMPEMFFKKRNVKRMLELDVFQRHWAWHRRGASSALPQATFNSQHSPHLLDM